METDEQVIQLRADEEESDGEVFLGDVPGDELPAVGGEDAGGADLEVDAASLPPVADAFAEAINALDAEKAGDAARPQYQPSIPGILPPFDWRRAQLTTESLEETVASCERTWDAAKKEATEAKKEFDEAVDTLRAHIQAMHRQRVDSEYQDRKPDAQTAPEDVVQAVGCAFERATGKPCPICRNPREGLTPADNTIPAHVAASAVLSQANDQLEASGLRAVIRELAGVELQEDTVRGWSAVERAQVLQHLELPIDTERPPHLGIPHEAAEPAGSKQACRICGAPMPFLPEDDKTWPIGQKVGADCQGDPAADAEPTRTVKPRHAKKTDRQKAKAKAAGTDVAADQVAEGKKKTAATGKGRKK